MKYYLLAVGIICFVRVVINLSTADQFFRSLDVGELTDLARWLKKLCFIADFIILFWTIIFYITL